MGHKTSGKKVEGFVVFLVLTVVTLVALYMWTDFAKKQTAQAEKILPFLL